MQTSALPSERRIPWNVVISLETNLMYKRVWSGYCPRHLRKLQYAAIILEECSTRPTMFEHRIGSTNTGQSPSRTYRPGVPFKFKNNYPERLECIAPPPRRILKWINARVRGALERSFVS